MPKFHVSFEASATFMIQVEIEADSEDHATALAERHFPFHRLPEIAEEVMPMADDAFLAGYQERSDPSAGRIIRAGITELDENSFGWTETERITPLTPAEEADDDSEPEGGWNDRFEADESSVEVSTRADGEDADDAG